MLVLQGFPAQGPLGDSSDMVRRAVPQGRTMVNQLYYHPSIIIWALGEQPSIENFEKLCHMLVTAVGEEDPTRFLQQGGSGRSRKWERWRGRSRRMPPGPTRCGYVSTPPTSMCLTTSTRSRCAPASGRRLIAEGAGCSANCCGAYCLSAAFPASDIGRAKCCG